MKNIHIMPTDKPSRLFDCFGKLGIGDYIATREGLQVTNQHIYITSDEEIKEGDWFIREGSIHKCFKVHKTDIEFLTSIDSVYCGSNTFWSKEYCKKIILTTDQELIKDGVQSIPDEFLDWFVKNPSCEKVEVINKGRSGVFSDGTIGIIYNNYKIIIPKQEPKQETLEEAAQWVIDNRYAKSELEKVSDFEMYNTIVDKCSKWQQQGYSDEEVFDLMNEYADDVMGGCSLRAKHWFEQFKKK
jgi:hypothetical protein